MWRPPYCWTSLEGGGYARGEEKREGGDGGDLHGGGGAGSAAGKVPTGATGERPDL